MIQLNSLQLPQGQEFYTITFQRIRFAIISPPKLDYLVAFSRSNQAELGKTQIRMQVDWVRTYLNFFKEINYVLLTQFQEVLLLPYLLRAFPSITIIATTLMAQLARIHLLSFQQKLKDFDATATGLTFQQSQDVLATYEQRFGIELTNNPTIFSLKEAEDTVGRIVKVNYFQVYDTERGVKLTPHPSGKNNGSCIWEFEGEITGEKILLVNDVSQHQWRTCQPYNLARLQLNEAHRPFNHIIFTRKALSNLTPAQSEEQRTTELLAKVSANMGNSICTVLVLADETAVVDLIPRMAFQPEGKCQAAFFSETSLHDFTNFCNSYADYLSSSFRNIIFSESPDYPLVHYSRLKEKGLIQIAGLEETAIKNKLPVKEIVLQNSPFVLFLKNYEHLLQTEDLSAIKENVKFQEVLVTIQNNFSKAHLQKLISAFPKANFYGFGVETGLTKVTKLPFNIRQLIGGEAKPCSMLAANLTSNTLHSYTLTNNELNLKPIKKEIAMLPKTFTEHIFTELTRRGVAVLHKDSSSLRTPHTLIALSPEDFTLKVTSNHSEEVLLIERFLSSMIQNHSF